jgi:hypothetical protein
VLSAEPRCSARLQSDWDRGHHPLPERPRGRHGCNAVRAALVRWRLGAICHAAIMAVRCERASALFRRARAFPRRAGYGTSMIVDRRALACRVMLDFACSHAEFGHMHPALAA